MADMAKQREYSAQQVAEHVREAPGRSIAEGDAGSRCCAQGFPAKVRDVEEGLADSADAVQERKRAELQRSLWDLGLAWGLVLVCCTHHLGHWLHGLGWHGAPALLAALPPPLCSGSAAVHFFSLSIMSYVVP